VSVKRILLTAVALLFLVALADLAVDVSKKYSRAAAVDKLVPSVDTSKLIAPVKKAEYRFLVIGDNGSGLAQQREVAWAMEGRCNAGGEYDGIFFLGDLIYPDGVESVDDPQWKSLYEDYYRSMPCLSKLVAYPVLGNHDYHLRPAAWIERHKTTPMFHFPARSWAVDFGNVVTVVGVDSEVPWFGGMDGLSAFGKQTAWRFVLGHHPLASASFGGGRHKTAGFVGNRVKDAICGNVHVYMSGHAHHLEHRPMIDCNIEHLISGAGGAGLQPADPKDPGTHFVGNRWGFIDLAVTIEKLDIRFFATNGDKLWGWTKPLPANAF